MTQKYHKILSRLGKIVARHRCPKCRRRDQYCTVDRSIGGVCVVECGDVFCDFVLVAKLVDGVWRATMTSDDVAAKCAAAPGTCWRDENREMSE
jgi:hypothetical protein